MDAFGSKGQDHAETFPDLRRNRDRAREDWRPKESRHAVNHASSFRPSEPDRAFYREIVATIEGQLSRLAQQATTADARVAAVGLRASWSRLVDLIDIEAAPAMRACPVCGRSGMLAATRCGYCWTTLSPLPPLALAPAAATPPAALVPIRVAGASARR
jgi:hypothetical protein